MKDFLEWHKKKSLINDRKDIDTIFFREKEVWWVTLGVNIGFEQDGKGREFRRPILILKKFNKFSVLAIPLTTRVKDNKYHVFCDLGDGKARRVVISQIRMIDTRRFIDKMGVVEENSFVQIKNAIKLML